MASKIHLETTPVSFEKTTIEDALLGAIPKLTDPLPVSDTTPCKKVVIESGSVTVTALLLE
jgi:hypothetical protein